MLKEVSPSKNNYLNVRRSTISLSEEVTASKKYLPLRRSNYMLEEVSLSQKK
jgi:hypothetical protein